MFERVVTARRKTADFLGPCRAVVPEVAVVHDKGYISRIDVPHQMGEFLFLPAVIRHVADQSEFESAALAVRPNGGAAG